MKKIYTLLGRALAVELGISLLLTASAFAADLNWSADTNITIGGNTYVIVSGSAATSLVVSGISATVAVPSGSTFTLKSTDRFLFTTSPTLGQTCSTADNRVTVIGAVTSEVITPTVGTTCTVISGAGSPPSGGGGHTPPASTPTPTPTPSATPTPKPGTTPAPSTAPSTPSTPSAPSSPTSPASAPNLLSTTLKAGATRGNGILALQQFLNSNGFVIANKGAGSPGKETKVLGPATKLALKKFQKSAGLKATGLVDSKTTAYLKAHGL